MSDTPPRNPDPHLVLPPRTRWAHGFPDVITHTDVKARDNHPNYKASKAGDAELALILAQDLLNPLSVQVLKELVGEREIFLLPITALEVAGFNAIPDAMAQVLSHQLGWRVSAGEIVQNNKVGHTKAKSFNRLVTPASFEGEVSPGAMYVLVDDHVGLGGTLANLKGYIETNGGLVIGMTTLTESRDARHIALQQATRDMLWEKHGEELDTLWQKELGHGIDCLTNVEGGILCREPTLESIRDQLAKAAVEASGRGLVTAL